MRRRLLPALIALLAAPFLIAPAPSRPEKEDARRAEQLREQLKQAPDRRVWEATARELLSLVDRDGRGRGNEAQWLVSHLLEIRPDDPDLLWRRAEQLRQQGDAPASLADLERLIRANPDHPLTIRARRAVPALLLAAGRKEDSAAADEALLAEGIADPTAVLSRLVRTYAGLGDKRRLRQRLDELRRAAPDRVRFDPELAWLDADSAEGPAMRAEAMLRFANLFPGDYRRQQALMNAGSAFRELGQEDLALALVSEALGSSEQSEQAAAIRLERGEILVKLGKQDDARREYEAVIDSSLDPARAAKALRALLDLEEQRSGTEGAALAAAALVRRGDPFIREMARNHFDRLLRDLQPKLEQDPALANFFFALASEMNRPAALSAGGRLAAAALRESVGGYESAAEIYAMMSNVLGREGIRAREGLARARPRPEPKRLEPNDPSRLAGLERERAWDVILQILDAHPPKGRDEPAQRTSGARAALATGDGSRARALLEPLATAAGETALLRGDARAIAGEWQGACLDFRRAARTIRSGVRSQWLQVRLAACELREDHPDRARERLERVLLEQTPMPTRWAAEDLLARCPKGSAGAPAS